MARRAGMIGVVAGALLTAGFVVAAQGRSWLDLDGRDWGTMDAAQRVAWTQGFLAGRALGQLPDSATKDTVQLVKSLGGLKREGGLVFPYAPSLYVSRMGDYYHWDNHVPHPLWRGMLDVNEELKR